MSIHLPEIFDHGGEKVRRLAARDDPVVEGDRERQHLSHCGLALKADGSGSDALGADERHLGQDDDKGGESSGAEDTKVR